MKTAIVETGRTVSKPRRSKYDPLLTTMLQSLKTAAQTANSAASRKRQDGRPRKRGAWCAAFAYTTARIGPKASASR